MTSKLTRRTVTAGLGAAVAMPWIARRGFAASKPIVIGVPATSTAAIGAADHGDHVNGSTMAVDEINRSGGVLGRELKQMVIDFDPLSPESGKQAIAQCIDAQVDAISNPYMLPPLPAMDASSQYKCPYFMALRTACHRRRSRQIPKNTAMSSWPLGGNQLRLDLSALAGARGKEGRWKPKNRKVHIVQEQIAYCQTISKCAQQAIKKRGKFEVARITDIQFPVQDWANVIRELKEADAGAIMVDHWVAAELRRSPSNSSPTRANSLVYLQYGPSQPEFLTLAGAAANGFCWSTVLGVYGDEKAKLSGRNTRSVSLASWASPTPASATISPTSQAGLGGVGDPRKFKEVVRLDSRQSGRGASAATTDMRQPVPGSPALPRQRL